MPSTACSSFQRAMVSEDYRVNEDEILFLITFEYMKVNKG
jgi:hypothetical protein